MTPAQLARAKCANNTVCRKGCKVAFDPPRACKYFERCVLALPDGGATIGNRRLSKEELAAGQVYLTTRDTGLFVRRCPGCQSVLPKRKRYCVDCAKRRRLESTRGAVSRHRGNGAETPHSAGAGRAGRDAKPSSRPQGHPPSKAQVNCLHQAAGNGGFRHD